MTFTAIMGNRLVLMAHTLMCVDFDQDFLESNVFSPLPVASMKERVLVRKR